MAIYNTSVDVRKSLAKSIIDEAKPEHGGCLIWRKTSKNINQYGKIPYNGDSIYVHRLVYYSKHPLPLQSSDEEVSHICHKKRCVQITHLVAETRSENSLRKSCSKSETGCLGKTRHNGPPCIVQSKRKKVC